MVKPPVRLADVAKQAGVSTKTASRVLNGHPSVAEGTRTAVLEAMTSLGYVPDPAARSLRSGVDRSVGVLVDSIGDIFFAELAAAVEAELHRHGYRAWIVSSNRDPQRELETVQMFVQRRCAGMIVAPLAKDSLAQAQTAALPVVFVDRVGELPGARSVVVDDVALGRQATQHLIAHGHTRIALISDRSEMTTVRDRHQGYREAMASHGITVDEELVCVEANEARDVVPVIKRLLDLANPPTAILSTNSRLSLGILPVLHQYGRTDIALISYGDFPLAESLSPAVSVIDHSATAIGQASVAALLPRLAGEPDHDEPIIYVPARLIARGSGELRPAKEPHDQQDQT